MEVLILKSIFLQGLIDMFQAHKNMEIVGRKGQRKVNGACISEKILQKGKFSFVCLKVQSVEGSLRENRSLECHISPVL